MRIRIIFFSTVCVFRSEKPDRSRVKVYRFAIRYTKLLHVQLHNKRSLSHFEHDRYATLPGFRRRNIRCSR